MTFCPACGTKGELSYDFELVEGHGEHLFMIVSCEACAYQGFANDVVGFVQYRLYAKKDRTT